MRRCCSLEPEGSSIPDRRSRGRGRLTLFGLLVVGCVAAAAVAVAVGISRTEKPEAADAAARGALIAARASGRPMVIYRDTAHAGQIDILAMDRPTAAPIRTDLSCDRVYFAAGSGICLQRGGGFAGAPKVKVFGPDLRVHHTLAVEGIPSRARVSPDGRYGSVTLFVAGHAYAAPGTFSTQTTLIDLRTGSKIADLEQFTVLKDGRQITAVDVNFWGVTFAHDGDTFYATLATGGKTYLIRGSIKARTAHVIHENVECPSLSPDGSRIAFKKRTGSSSAPWRLTILDLATMHETPLAETRSVDDQAEWDGDDHVLYSVDNGIWTVSANGRGTPRHVIPSGDSPAVVRW